MSIRGVMVIAVMAACGGGEAKPDAATVYEDAAVCVPGSQATSTLYLNFTGATFTAGPSDAILNKADVGMTRTLAPWPHANAAGIKACVETALKPFKINVTDVDPGSTMHHEVVLTDVFWVPEDPQVRSISQSNCGQTILNTVSFVFAAASGDSALITCKDVLLQFAVASAELDHTLACDDYLAAFSCGTMGPWSWTTTPAQCGDDTARPCNCGGSHQISMKKMTDRFGASCAE